MNWKRSVTKVFLWSCACFIAVLIAGLLWPNVFLEHVEFTFQSFPRLARHSLLVYMAYTAILFVGFYMMGVLSRAKFITNFTDRGMALLFMATMLGWILLFITWWIVAGVN